MASNAFDARDYGELEKIGQGSFGIIRKVKRKTDGKILCRKEIQYVSMSTKEREQLQAEFSILSSLRHPNIVAYYHRHHLKENQELHLYMEYCGGGDLSKVIRNLKTKNQLAEEPFVWSIVSQLVTALYRCHYGEAPPDVGKNILAIPAKPTALRQKSQVTILHRDLKPENVFLGEDNTVKLGDFGLSKLMQSHDFASTYVGTPFYMSPEICAAERYTSKSDIWSLGCIVYELCTRDPPFNAKTHFHLVQKIKEGRFDPLPSIYSPDLQNLVKSCLVVNPSRRPDTWDLLQLPIVRLMRKEREVVELGETLRSKELDVTRKTHEINAMIKGLDKDKQELHTEVEATVRREWEVKARLEIDRQVNLEKERLSKVFEAELAARLRAELNRDAAGRKSDGEDIPSQLQVPHLSSVSTLESSEGPHTDLSSLSLESPATETSSAGLAVQPKKTTRTPFSRARTQVDSPMDVHMASPSPMSIASLSLSPRRAAALGQGITTQNLFGANKNRLRRKPQILSPTQSEDEGESDGSDDNDAPELSSPTRKPRVSSGPSGLNSPDPFKSRPGMKRQKTLPGRRLSAKPNIFNAQSQAVNSTSQIASGGSTSPTRRIPRPLSKAQTQAAPSSSDDMFRAVVKNNMTNANAVGGRTLVELQQARAGLSAPMSGGGNPKANRRASDIVAASWDPETEEMPSPFLSRTRKMNLVR